MPDLLCLLSATALVALYQVHMLRVALKCRGNRTMVHSQFLQDQGTHEANDCVFITKAKSAQVTEVNKIGYQTSADTF